MYVKLGVMNFVQTRATTTMAWFGEINAAAEITSEEGRLAMVNAILPVWETHLKCVVVMERPTLLLSTRLEGITQAPSPQMNLSTTLGVTGKMAATIWYLEKMT